MQYEYSEISSLNIFSKQVEDIKNQANGIGFRQYRSERRGSLSPRVLSFCFVKA